MQAQLLIRQGRTSAEDPALFRRRGHLTGTPLRTSCYQVNHIQKLCSANMVFSAFMQPCFLPLPLHALRQAHQQGHVVMKTLQQMSGSQGSDTFTNVAGLSSVASLTSLRAAALSHSLRTRTLHSMLVKVHTSVIRPPRKHTSLHLEILSHRCADHVLSPPAMPHVLKLPEPLHSVSCWPVQSANSRRGDSFFFFRFFRRRQLSMQPVGFAADGDSAAGLEAVMWTCELAKRHIWLPRPAKAFLN